MTISYRIAGLAFLLAGCVGEVEVGPAFADIRSDPSILFMAQGETKTVTVEAFVANEPQAVRWNVGRVGAGLSVVEDTTYGTVYNGENLGLPARSHSRRYEVTMSDTVASDFVISGGTAVITIPVLPPVAP